MSIRAGARSDEVIEYRRAFGAYAAFDFCSASDGACTGAKALNRRFAANAAVAGETHHR